MTGVICSLILAGALTIGAVCVLATNPTIDPRLTRAGAVVLGLACVLVASLGADPMVTP